MVLVYVLLNTQHYKEQIKRKVEQETEERPSLYLDVVANEKGAFGLPSTAVDKFTYFIYLLEVGDYKLLILRIVN